MKEIHSLELGSIIFDFDGTLAYLNIDFEEMRRQLLSLIPEFGLDPDLMRGRYLLEGMEEAIQALRARGSVEGAFEFERRAEEMLVNIETRAAQESFLLPGVSAALQDLRGRGLSLGIITRNSALAVNSILSRDSLAYDLLLAREDVGRARVKPHPQHLERAIEGLGGTPSTSLMVGDHPLDIRVAQRAGTYSAGVLSGRHRRSDFEEAGADLILESVADLPSLFTCSRLRVIW
ncbi:MAG: HAD family hydrolase [candidate division NC10 bacterium]|nr:HAD family hydrolase [candidate division NC10 bacterium]